MVCKETQWERWQWHSLPDSGTDVTGMGHAVETQTSPQNETIHSGMRMRQQSHDRGRYRAWTKSRA
jgi:hypothetical protein